MNPRALRRAVSRACLALSTAAAALAVDTVTLTGHAMGTSWTVKYLPPGAPAPTVDPATVTARVTARLEEIEQAFSTYRPGSEVSQFNSAASTDWIPVAPDVARVAVRCRHLSELTGGAFDVTVEPLVRLWGFGTERRSAALPTDTEIATARARTGYRRVAVRLSPPALRKDSPLVSADFSSMAKGFASDAVGEVLLALGATDHFIQIGGDIKTAGHPTRASSWRTGIESPASPSGAALAAVVALSGQALSTSGAAHNFTVIAGQHYGHIIDPRTGRPAGGNLASVSVIHESCASSSALATALFVLGPDAGLALATRENLAALFLVHTGEGLALHATPAFARFRASPP